MKIHSLFRVLIATAVMACWSQAQALVVTFDDLLDSPPIVTCNLELCVITTGFEVAHVTGRISPFTSQSPLTTGTTFATLLEPGADPFGPRISDIVRLIVGPIEGFPFGQFQRITLDFFSDGAPGFDQIIPAGLLVPGVLETGAFQDLTALLGISFPLQNVQVMVRSDFNSAEVPEPVTLALLAIGLAGLGFSSRRKVN